MLIKNFFYCIFLFLQFFLTVPPIYGSESLSDIYKKQKECTWVNADFKSEKYKYCIQPDGRIKNISFLNVNLETVWMDGYLGMKLFRRAEAAYYFYVVEWQIENNQLIKQGIGPYAIGKFLNGQGINRVIDKSWHKLLVQIWILSPLNPVIGWFSSF